MAGCRSEDDGDRPQLARITATSRA
jgi:hypothetical protein